MNAATKIQASFRGHMARKQAEKGGPTDAEIKEKEATEKVEEPKVDKWFQLIRFSYIVTVLLFCHRCYVKDYRI